MKLALLFFVLLYQSFSWASVSRFDFLIGKQYRQLSTNSVESEQVDQTNLSLAYSYKQYRGVFDWTSEYNTTSKESGFKITSREKDLSLWAQWNPIYSNKYAKPLEPFVSAGFGLRKITVQSDFQGIQATDQSSADNIFYGIGAGLRLPLESMLFSLEGRYLAGPAMIEQNEFLLMFGVGMNIPTLSNSKKIITD